MYRRISAIGFLCAAFCVFAEGVDMKNTTESTVTIVLKTFPEREYTLSPGEGAQTFLKDTLSKVIFKQDGKQRLTKELNASDYVSIVVDDASEDDFNVTVRYE